MSERIYNNITELIGRTPLLRLNSYEQANSLNAAVMAKLECFNPTGSIKDRSAVAMINDAEAKGLLKPDTVIIEPTSGNCGIGLASAATALGYKLMLIMPETISMERRVLLTALGAELVLTDGAKGMRGSIAKAKELAIKNPNSFIPNQFSNPSNPNAHKTTTGVEIWEDSGMAVDIFVAGIGTGGTISGAGEFLRSKNPSIKIVAVEPEDSAILSRGVSGPHKIQGIGAGIVPEVLNTNIYDEIITVTNNDAFDATRAMAKTEGILVGVSSGAALFVATQLANRAENAGKNIIFIAPDSGERYLFSSVF